MHAIKTLLSKAVNRETISYLVFGVLTTAINILAFGLLHDFLHWDLLVANSIAWVLSVAFAFVTNKVFVFRSKGSGASVLLRESLSFFAARIVSLGVDSAGMWFLADVLLVNSWIAKFAMNVVVVILNYILSKLWIFRKPR